ncbi:MAG: hypothetical protein AAGI13_00735 [Pseudomonadota bacterium]
MFLSLICLVASSLLFWMLYPSGGLFVVNVETSRMDYDVTGVSRNEIAVEGAIVQVGQSWVVDRIASQEDPQGPFSALTHPAAYCYTGILTPRPGTRVELAVEEGMQVLRISPSDFVPDPPPSLRETRPGPNRSPDGPQMPSFDADGEEGARFATLSYNGRDLFVFDGQGRPPPYPDPDAKAEEEAEDPLNLLLLPPETESTGSTARASVDQTLFVGDFPLNNAVTVTADPICAAHKAALDGRTDVQDGDFVTFATRAKPITVAGPAVVGRKLRTKNETTIVDDDFPHLGGDVEVLIREVLCLNLLSSQWFNGIDAENRGCRRIYRVATEPVSLPPGSALTATLNTQREERPSFFFGQVSYEDGRYEVGVSTEADIFKILRPGSGGQLDNSNIVSVPLIDRILLEPALILFASLFFTFSGLVLGILQIEDDDNPSKD